MAYANRISYLRKKRGFSMQKLAHKVGTSQQQIDRLEKGQRRLTVEWMQRLSEALDCSIMDLLPDVGSERDYATARAKVIGAIDASNGQLVEFEEREVYTLVFGRPKNVNNPRLFALVVRGDGFGLADGTELVLAEQERNQRIENGRMVLCAERSGQYYLRQAPIENKDEVIKAVVIKIIHDVA